MKQAYLVYPGLGKTTLAKIETRITDIETKVFKDASLAQYIGTTDYPNYRGMAVEKINPDWPNNLYEYARREVANGRIIVSAPKKDSYDMLNALGITNYAFVMPNSERLKQLQQAYITRGDDTEYIKHNMNDRYNSVLNYAQEQGKEVIFLKPGEYLFNILSIIE